jgi:hypothetical protein
MDRKPKSKPKMDPQDGGAKSRKLWFSVYAITVMVASALIGARLPAFAPMYDTLVGGIVAVTAAFLTGNVAAKWVIGKSVVTTAESPKKKPAESKETQPVEHHEE